jgi:hypothetical protein
MRLNRLSVLFLLILFSFSVSTYAGNPGNSSEAGNVTAIVVCEADETESEPIPISVETSKVAINADGCECEIVDPEELACDNEESCAFCLATLQRTGLNIYHANTYVEPTEVAEDNLVTIHHYNLTGNAGPFIERWGGCPCPEPD